MTVGKLFTVPIRLSLSFLFQEVFVHIIHGKFLFFYDDLQHKMFFLFKILFCYFIRENVLKW